MEPGSLAGGRCRIRVGFSEEVTQFSTLTEQRTQSSTAIPFLLTWALRFNQNSKPKAEETVNHLALHILPRSNEIRKAFGRRTEHTECHSPRTFPCLSESVLDRLLSPEDDCNASSLLTPLNKKRLPFSSPQIFTSK